MSIILDRGEPTIGVAEVARQFPASRGSGRVHPQTIVRWIQKGVRAANGERIKLEAIRVGYRWMTSEAALKRFLMASTVIEPETAALRTPAQRHRASEEAGAQLEKVGA
jgi:hypothetical protein